MYNGHGDVVKVVDSNGRVTKDYEYDAFGVVDNENATDINPWRYCGEYYDTETGNIFLRARYYDPSTGSFITEDPARDGVNWYSYCAGNPVSYIDPSGMYYIVEEYDWYLFGRKATGRYYIQPENYIHTAIKTTDVTFGIYEYCVQKLVGYVGGSSYNDIGGFIKGTITNLGANTIFEAIEEGGSKVSSNVLTLFTIGESTHNVDIDNIAIDLMNKHGVSIVGNDKEKLIADMEGTLDFIEQNKSYFMKKILPTKSLYDLHLEVDKRTGSKRDSYINSVVSNYTGNLIACGLNMATAKRCGDSLRYELENGVIRQQVNFSYEQSKNNNWTS